MPDERLTRAEVKSRIRDLESQRRGLTKQIRELEDMERNMDWDDRTDMINKCFRRSFNLPGPNGPFECYEYVCIIGLPPMETNKAGTSYVNMHQYPAMYFYFCPTRFMPFDTADCDDYGDVFYYSTLFAGQLPEQYRRGAIWNGFDPLYEEIEQFKWIDAAEKRYREFIRKIFEPTTPAW